MYRCKTVKAGNLHWSYAKEDEIFKNLVFVVGMGKSDLSTAVELLCTFKPTYHLYTPVILKTIPPNAENGLLMYFRHMIASSLMYDHVIPQVRGMYICDDPYHRTYSENYWATCLEQRLERRKNHIDSFGGADQLEHERPVIAADICEGIMWQEIWQKIFPECKFVHVVRNGLDIINAIINVGWFQGRHFYAPSAPTIDWFKMSKENEGIEIPWWVNEPEALECWDKWDKKTRFAHMWRIQVEKKFPDIKYETLFTKPKEIGDYYMNNFCFLRPTQITDNFFNRHYVLPEETHGLTINDIEEPERSKFKFVMEKLEYL